MRSSRLSKSLFLLTPMIPLLLAFGGACCGQPPVAQRKVPPPPPKTALQPAPLSAEQKVLFEEQARYYKAQAEEIDRTRDFWGKVKGNPVAVAAVLGAFATIFLGLLNYRQALRNQQDTQLYEALKRIGDGSPAVRSSAAGALAQIGKGPQFRWTWSAPWRSWWQTPYLQTARHQLTAGIELESHPVVIYSIAKALHEEVVPTASEAACGDLSSLNWRLQLGAIRALADFFAVRGAQAGKPIPPDLWQRVPSVGRGMENVWRDLVDRPVYRDEFDRLLRVSPYTAAGRSTDPSHVGGSQAALLTAYERLNTSANLLAKAIADCNRSNVPLLAADLEGAFLVCVDLSSANLQHVSLKRAILLRSDLTRACLYCTDMSAARLAETKLAGAQIDSVTDMADADWWHADFADEEESIDACLIHALYARYGKHLPADLNQVHPSVREFIAQRRREETGGGEETTGATEDSG